MSQRPPPLPITPYQPPSLPPSHGYSVSSAALLAGTPRVTSVPSLLPSYPQKDPPNPSQTSIYARPKGVPVLPSPYQAGEASRPQQYQQMRNADGSFAGGTSASASASGGSGSGGGPGSRGPYQKKGPGPFAVPLRQMMFGFGDEPEPPEDTVAVMEDLLGHFVQELCSLPPLPSTHLSSSNPPKPRLITSHSLRSNLSSSPLSLPLLSRLQELTVLQKDVNAAKKPFDAPTDDITFKAGGGVAYNEEGAEVVLKKKRRRVGPAEGGTKKKKSKKKVVVDGEGAEGAEGAAAAEGGEGAAGGEVEKEKKKLGRPKGDGKNVGAGPSI
ncbi:hypothetical protein BDY24DRAFT_381418 [Mrakia frigida]|uniref:uncharacterized protein n=1 Tax=Mrakia frigida TaxID=29902 RepID=UPI003FCC2728